MGIVSDHSGGGASPGARKGDPGDTSDDELRFGARINLDKVRQVDEMIGSKALDSVSDSRPEAYAAPLLGG